MQLGNESVFNFVASMQAKAPKAERKKWFKAEAKDDILTLNIYDAIDDWYGVDAQEVVSSIRGFEGSNIDVFVNSPGGDVFAGMAIFNALKQSKATVNVTIDGIAASIASVIALAGDSKPKMGVGTRFMIHNAWTIGMGNHKDFRQLADVLESVSNDLKAVYAEVTGKSMDDITLKMDSETYFSKAEAEDFGFAFVEGDSDKKADSGLAAARLQLARKLALAKLADIADTME